MRWLFLLTITVLLPIVTTQPASAQEAPPALAVRLRDVMGAGVAGAEVIVTDDSGVTVLARATSDAEGLVRFGPLPVTEVRVVVQGRLADGTLLVQPGADAEGIAVILGAPPVTLELRSEADGTVLPDPARELALEPGVEAPEITLVPAQVPPAPPAQAPIAPPGAPFPTPPPAGDTIITLTPVRPEAAASSDSPTAFPIGTASDQPAALSPWQGLLLLGVLLLAVVAVAIVQLRWRRS